MLDRGRGGGGNLDDLLERYIRRSGMVCPKCESGAVVVDVRTTEWCIRRRYKCKRCEMRFTTREVLVMADTEAWKEVRHDTLRRYDDIRRANAVRGKQQIKR